MQSRLDKLSVFCHNPKDDSKFRPSFQGGMVNKGDKKFDFPIGLEPMSEQEASEQMKDFFAKLKEEFKDTPEEELKASAQKIEGYIKGEVSWAELMNFTPEMLYHIADYGYRQFKTGRYPDAERVFKVLTVLDWKNAYYHSMMGSILQKQKRYGEAIAEYSEAIKLDPNDIISLTNRGEIYLRHHLNDDAKKDLELALALNKEEDDPFAARAKLLLEQLAEQSH